MLISEHLSELLYTRGCKIKNSIEGRQLIWNKPMRAVGRDDVSAKTGKHRSPGATNIQIEKEKKKKKKIMLDKQKIVLTESGLWVFLFVTLVE